MVGAELTDELYRRKILPLPPYQFTVSALKDLHNINIKHPEAWPYFEIIEKTFEWITSPEKNETFRMIEIEEDLIPLIENTDNKIFYRPLFFPTIFINNEFIYENFIIKGITILDIANAPPNIHIEDIEKQEYLIIYTYARIDDIDIGARTITLFRNILEKDDKLANHIRLLICNIVDMVEGNDEDLEFTTIHTSKEQNIKRIKRGKIPFPTKVFIRPKKEFKQYVHDFNLKDKENKEQKLHYKFLVRGHWRHFRAERFVRKKGEKIWIKPFYKGQGIVISKEYKLIK